MAVATVEPQVNAVLSRAKINVGVRRRVKSAMQVEFGSLLIDSAPAASAASAAVRASHRGGSSAEAIAAPPQQPTRVWYLARPALLVIVLAPHLPVHTGPSLTSAICGARPCGELVCAVAESSGWLQLRAAVHPVERSGGWALWVRKTYDAPCSTSSTQPLPPQLSWCPRSDWSLRVMPSASSVPDHGRMGDWQLTLHRCCSRSGEWTARS